MATVELIERNPVITDIVSGTKELVTGKVLYYTYEYWRPGRFKKERKIIRKNLVSKYKGKDKHYMLTGFVPRAVSYLEKYGYDVVYKKKEYGIKVAKPLLKGITFREDQMKPLGIMLSAGRGVWVAPTGSGKTILFLGLVSAYVRQKSNQCKVLIVVNSKDLLIQTADEAKKFFGAGLVGVFGGGKKDTAKCITVSTVQSLARLGTKVLVSAGWDVVIVDECHHVSSFSGMYAKVLLALTSTPIRFGVTATLPEGSEAKACLEGLIGEVLGRTKYSRMSEAGVLAEPIVNIYQTPRTERYSDVKGGYKTVYEVGIVRNRARNRLILLLARDAVRQGRTVLIMVEQIRHGEELLRLSEILMPGVFVFLHGDTPDDIREQEKQVFEKRKRVGVIATRIWSEGVNIKSIGCVINAVGGMSEIAAVQRFGRGLRRTKDKKDVVLVDFIDTHHKWFVKHSLERINTYLGVGWKLQRPKS